MNVSLIIPNLMLPKAIFPVSRFPWFKNGLARLVVAFLIGAHMGARENDAFRGEFTNEISRDVVRMNFAVDVGFAHASGDQLGHLAAEVQNQDAVVRHGLECFFCGGD